MKKIYQVLLLSIILFSACSKKSDNPQPTPNPGGGTGTCQGFTTKDFFVLNAQWQETDTVNNLQNGTIFTILSSTAIGEAYYNGTTTLKTTGNYSQTDCLKFTMNLSNYTNNKFVFKFVDAKTVYLVAESAYNSVDFSKQHKFYKRIK